MRVALINSPSLALRPVSRSMAGGLGFDGHDDMVLPPLDLALLAATLRSAGDAVELVDADPLRLDAHAVCERLAQGQWDAIIATVSLPTLEQDAAFLVELRRHSDATIIAKTLVRDHTILRTLLEKSRADLVIHGEADLTIAEIVRGRSTAGTAWLEAGSAEAFRFDAGEPVHDLDQLPLPARDLLPNDRYRYPLLGGPVATLQTSRGCPYPCGYYCPYPLVEGVKWRSQTPERIVAELKDIVERFGMTKVYFRDATFTLNQERIVRLCDLILDAGWRLEWVCETRVDCLSDALLAKMRQAGCVGMLIGVETGDEAIMHHREGKKGLTVSKLAHLRQIAAELGLRLHFLLIVGLPQETRDSLVATYDLIQRYKPDTIGVTIITPYPGTPLYEEGLREGWIDSRQWHDYGGHQVPMHTPNLTREDLITGKRFLEEGFAILQRRQTGGHSRPLEALAVQHYRQLLNWAYRLDEPAAELRQVVADREEVRASKPVVPRVQQQLAARPADDSAPAVSVVMPTYNRRTILRKTLLAYAAQTVPPDRFEVIVVDDGSSDDTVAMLKQFKAPFPLRVLPQQHGGANTARNVGLRAAAGALVLITGDDMLPEPSLLEAHLKFHAQHPDEMDAMLGFVDWSPEIPVTPFMRFIVSPEGGQQFAFHEVRNGMADFRLFYTSNVSLKRTLLLKQRILFDPDFTYPAYDDTEFGYRLSRQGLQLHYNALAVVRHHHDITVERFVGRQRKAGQMARIFARKHPELADTVLAFGDIVRQPSGYHDGLLATLLPAALELEKPNLTALQAIRVNQHGFDEVYLKSVLYPIYEALLRAAYAAGIHDRQTNTPSIPVRSTKSSTVSIIIPVFNKVELTQQCLTHLADVTQHVEYEVIIVDNASSDGTHEFLRALGGNVQIIRNEENLGFAKACNQGARAARGQYLLFLNNDTIPLQGWLTPLLEEVEADSGVAVVGSKLLYADGTIQHAGVVFSRGLSPYHVYRAFPGDAPVVNRRREYQCVTAACMLVRRDVFQAVGGFDEAYHNGFEDVDLCLQIRERGGRIVYQPKSVLYHLESQTPGRKAHEADNARRLLSRWGACWWLADEDAVYVADGYVQRTYTEQGCLKGKIEPLPENERAAWERVAKVQRFGHARNLPAMKAELAEAAAWPQDAHILRWAAHLSGWVGAGDCAESFWRAVLRIEDAVDARVALARIALEQGRLEEAESHLAVLNDRAPSHGEGALLCGVLAMQQGRYGEARTAFEAALRHGGDRRKCRLGAGMAAMGMDDSASAWPHFVEALTLAPDDQEALHWLLRCGTVLQCWSDLVAPLQRFAARNPADLAARFALAGVAWRLGRTDIARAEYQAIRLLNPDYDGLHELATALDRGAVAASSTP